MNYEISTLRIMEKFNDITSEIYIQTRDNQSKFIDNRLSKSKLPYLKNNMKLLGTIEEIMIHLNLGIAQNLVQSFFKHNDKTKEICCANCGKGKGEVRQFDRAHCNRPECHRRALLRKAIEKYYVDENTPVNSADILRQFLENHKEAPIYFMCPQCHKEYDKDMPKEH